MLRDDFEKFRKVCPGSLAEGFSYSDPKSDSHYTIHKVRLDATYFSTEYSGHSVFPDGVFIDLLIYDRTSKHNFSRIDLGRYVFDPYEEKPFRPVDIRGELYETSYDNSVRDK